MSKAILVIDMPKCCDKCPLFFGAYSNMCCRALNNKTIDYPYPINYKPDWCPLKPAPEYQDIWYNDEKSDWERGYNNCLHEIVGD